jgi:hypothetical protein
VATEENLLVQGSGVQEQRQAGPASSLGSELKMSAAQFAMFANASVSSATGTNSWNLR